MHRSSLLRVAPILLAASFAFACSDDTVGTDSDGNEVGDCAAKLSRGQLVITEIMPDPAGSDDSSYEWFELYNPTDAAISLTGVGLEYSKVDGSDAKGHLIKDELRIEPGQYLVFGKATSETLPDHINYGFAADLGSFSNTDGKVRVVCGDVVVDDALYQDLADGISRSLGTQPPDADENDDLANWCDATEIYAGSEYGTPGAQNPACPLAPTACGQCYENDLLRPAKVPAPGQLVITEVMPNASLSDATAGEWFEVYVSAGEVDLNCLQFGGNTSKFVADPSKPEGVVNQAACATVSAGTYVVFAEHATWQSADFEAKITLVDSPSASNPNPGVYIAYDGQILDEVHYEKTNDGKSWSLDPGSLTAAGNDDPINWCVASTPFDEGDLGSPGAENPECPVAAPEGTCIAGDAPRDIVYASPGDLIVTEVFTDPMLGDTANAEWIELFVGADIDLNGLTFGKTLDAPYTVVDDPTCRPIAAGSYVLIAHSDDPALNGGLPTPDWVGNISLTNDNSNLVVGVDNKRAMTVSELDAVAWTTTADGKSRQLPLATLPAAVPFDVTVNDDPTQWCDGAAMFGAGDLGTPKAENLACDVIPPGNQCLDPDTQQLRDVVSPSVGDLIITEIHADPDALIKSGGAGEPAGEWFEIYAASSFDLNGIDLGNTFPTKKHTITSATCLPVAADSHVLLSRLGEPLNPPNPDDLVGNGGLPAPNYEYAGLSLSNSGAGLYLALQDTQLDAVTFTKPSAGKAHQLSSESNCISPAPLDTACNDDFAAVWCAASTPYGLGDSGTPQAPNLACGGGNMDPMCFDQGLMAMRAIVSPAPGDLVINEFLADPTVVTDANGEWFEIKVINSVDLNDLKIINKANVDMVTLAAAKPLLVSTNCLPAAAGTIQLFAHNNDPMINGNLPAVDHVVSTSLGNASGGISIGKADVLLHTVGWTVAQKAGKSSQLDPDGLVDPMNTSADGPPWCVAVNAGTPKQENPQCP
jgi:hypothetical protein